MSALIEFRDVSLGYEGRTILSGISFSVLRGDLMGVVGPNGSGKTTILRGILGLLHPQTGSIHHQGTRPRFGYVPQRQTIDENFPLTALEVARMGRFRQGKARLTDEDEQLTRTALTSCGAEGLSDHLFRSLSGGQKQRVLIARALASRPDLLVLDEPTSGMDLRGTAATMDLIHRLNEDGLTVVLVSHQLDTVATRARTLGMLHQGRLEVGTVAEILTAETLQRVYGPGADVVEVRGQRVVLPPRSEP